MGQNTRYLKIIVTYEYRPGLKLYEAGDRAKMAVLSELKDLGVRHQFTGDYPEKEWRDYHSHEE